MPKKESIAATLARRIKELREAKGLSKYRLATDADINVGYLGDIEAGEKVPGWEIACRLADALGVSVADFR